MPWFSMVVWEEGGDTLRVTYDHVELAFLLLQQHPTPGTKRCKLDDVVVSFVITKDMDGKFCFVSLRS